MKSDNKNLLVWVLADDRAGNVAQVVGVAENLGIPYIRKNIFYNKLSNLPNFLKFNLLIGIDLSQSDPLTQPWPDLVISAGRKTAPIAYYIKKKSAGKTKIIHLMRPEMPINFFDLIVMPHHDNFKDTNNIIKIIGAPNKINDKLLSQAKLEWNDKLSFLPSPKIAVLVGGNTKLGNFSESEAEKLSKILNDFAAKYNGSLLISTSRRTPENCTNIIKNNISVPNYFFNAYSKDANPYLGFLAWADVIIVSGDSVSMCSEACATGRPVYIYCPENLIPQKHKKFHQQLYKENYARPFDNNLEIFVGKKLTSTNDLSRIIKDKFVSS